MARCGPKSKRTPAEIYTALETVKLIGLRGTSRLTGLPLTTLYDWKELEEKGALEEFINEKCSEEYPGECPASSDEEISLLRQQGRAVFVEKALNLTLKILSEMESKMSEATFKDLAVSFGVLLDKILLLTGNPTSRTESVTSVNREELLRAVQEINEKVKVLPPPRQGNKR